MIGSDCPTLTVADVQSAFDRLKHHDVVLGPTEDGGYYLIGARHEMPDVFTNIAWSTPQVWAATVDRLSHFGTRWSALQTRYDVDDVHDVRRLKQELMSDLDESEEWDALRRCLERSDI